MQPVRISLQSIVADIWQTWPQTTRVFHKYRMNCAGCQMAKFETLEDVLRIYNLPAEPLLADLNRMIRLEAP